MGLWEAICIAAVVVGGVARWSTVGGVGIEDVFFNETELSLLESVFDRFSTSAAKSNQLYVPITFIKGADPKAVCLDGSLPAYHIDRGFGTGEKSWIVHLEGGGWCNSMRTCTYSSKNTHHGSSKFMEKWLPFTGILSNKAEENPDFYNWNRVKVRYCDGASFTGDTEANGLQFRGQRIWKAAMNELMMSKGMRYANQALLSGCSAGGLAAILHCDEFRNLFPQNTKVKCLSDAGLFMNARDISGRHTLRKYFGGVVKLQGSGENLPNSCNKVNKNSDPNTCFFPQNVISNIRTPLFILNTAYDSWQIQASLAPSSADPNGTWYACKNNHNKCSSSQINFFQGFRAQMLRATRKFATFRKNGLFINSCFAHCQSERQDTWYANNSPAIGKKKIALAVGDWYTDRAAAKHIDCPYPCDKTCHNLVFR
ncbi:unnamed protein product [Cuscuta campestris]|uniref:Pectin acetylesterase n=2 Tax=Cuscuta sect. Cleistogrammica TaxID=1824901 RepID=A0A484M7S3_9ASTE|nr:hypothetical protein DM860_007503 [Cuscuta australis]VFQ84863.1 unnamed protein product [Cuscuta campestris]